MAAMATNMTQPTQIASAALISISCSRPPQLAASFHNHDGM